MSPPSSLSAFSSSPSSPPPSLSSQSSSNPFVGTNLFPEAAWIILSVCLVIIGLCQWGSVLHSKVVRRRKPQKYTDEESTHASSHRRTGWSFTRLPLAALNVFRVVAFRWTLEVGTYDFRVVDIVVTSLYVAFLLFWTYMDDEELGVTPTQVSLWSGRAALTAASQLPFVTALGTKNNVVSLITGIGYEKLNFFHRVAARSCFGLLIIHASGEIYTSIGSSLNQTWLRCGITALTSLAVLSIISLRPIRTKAYEFFFYMHFILVLVILIAAYFHTSESNVSYWIWPSFVVWGFDRFVRVARVVFCNHLYFGFSRRARLQDATPELLSDDFVRIRVRRPPHFQWWPGQTAYLIMPTVSTFPLEAHPFSISNIDSLLFRSDSRRSTESAEAEGPIEEESAQWKELVFLINVRRGFTKRLKDVAMQNQSVKLFIDGPYGATPDVAAYDTSVFVAGGSGVTYTLPVFLNVIEAAQGNPVRCRRVVFMWAIRDVSHVQWISNALLQVDAFVPTWLTVSIRIFVTRGAPSLGDSQGSDLEQTSEQEASDKWVVPSSVCIEYGRPDLKSILQGEVETATGSMLVTVCGSQSITRSVRRALRFPVSGPSSVLSGGPSVTLHVESFGYA